MKKLIVLVLLLTATMCFGQVTRHGSSLSFDGVNDSVNCGNSASLNLGANMTLESWVRFPGVKNSVAPYGDIVSKFNWTPGGFGFSRYDNNKYLLYIGAAPNQYLLSSANAVDTMGNWQYVVWTKWGTDSFNCYVNGVRKGQRIAAIPALVGTNSELLTLGVGKMGGIGLFERVNLDEVRLYNRALTPTEIAWNYRHPSQPYSRDSLKLWLQFNEFTGTTTADSSGNGNNGTISGATWNIETPVISTICPKP